MKRRTLIRDRAALSVEIEDLSKANIQDLRERRKILSGRAPGGHEKRWADRKKKSS